MEGLKSIKTVLISVYHKTGMEPLLEVFRAQGVRLISTGGTAVFLRQQGFEVTEVSDITGFPEILDGRVKTLHPLIFGGILAVQTEEKHRNQMQQHRIHGIDCVIVDLYPFHETLVNPESSENDIKNQIDIGGVALLRAGAKNHEFVATISHFSQYGRVADWLNEGQGQLTQQQRKQLGAEALRTTAAYDQEISDWMAGFELPSFACGEKQEMRYGENPHQQAAYFGNLSNFVTTLSGKALSYNNLNDLDAALGLIREFRSDEIVVAILKHTQSCGLATGLTVEEAWDRCLACDPTSAFGGVIISNAIIDLGTANKIQEIFFEILIAPGYTEEALTVLKTKKNRIILRDTGRSLGSASARSVAGGMLVQSLDIQISKVEERKAVAGNPDLQHPDIRFGEIAVKHLKSNAIALVRDGQLIGAGSGQTSRVDAVRHAIAKARHGGFDTKGALLASDAFFPFPDSLQLAKEAGIGVVVQPGGSVKDEENIEYCRAVGLEMVFTGLRHFKH